MHQCRYLNASERESIKDIVENDVVESVRASTSISKVHNAKAVMCWMYTFSIGQKWPNMSYRVQCEKLIENRPRHSTAWSNAIALMHTHCSFFNHNSSIICLSLIFRLFSFTCPFFPSHAHPLFRNQCKRLLFHLRVCLCVLRHSCHLLWIEIHVKFNSYTIIRQSHMPFFILNFRSIIFNKHTHTQRIWIQLLFR